MARRGKYGAVPTEVDGIRFASKGEARRYSDLKLLERAGEITHLELQPVYPIVINGVRVGKYVADFRYREKDGRLTVEDFKGVRTPLYRMKRKLVEAIYPGVTITETRT